MELTYQDYLKLDTLAYISRFSNRKYKTVSDFVEEYKNQYHKYIIGEEDKFRYKTMFNDLYHDDFAENDDISIFDLIRDDKDLFKHQRAYELRREHRRVHHLGDSYRQMLRERKDSQQLTAVKHVLRKPLPFS